MARQVKSPSPFLNPTPMFRGFKSEMAATKPKKSLKLMKRKSKVTDGDESVVEFDIDEGIKGSKTK